MSTRTMSWRRLGPRLITADQEGLQEQDIRGTAMMEMWMKTRATLKRK